MRYQTKKNWLAELTGTAVLVFAGTAAFVFNDPSGGQIQTLWGFTFPQLLSARRPRSQAAVSLKA